MPERGETDDSTARSETGTVSTSAVRAKPPLVAHVLYRLDVGGLENGLVNLINAIPEHRFRHAIVCLTEYTDFRRRIRRQDVEYHALRKREGKDPSIYLKLWRLFRRMRPDIVHTRNLAALDAQIPAALAGVPCRIHGEHGRDIFDLDGSSRKYNLLRRAVQPLVHRYIPLSRDLENWLRERVGVPPRKLVRIYNGVDSLRYQPAREPLPPQGFAPPGTIVIGTVGRMQPVKDTLTLVRAFLYLVKATPGARERLRLVLVGDGPLHAQAAALLEAEGAGALVWLAGNRNDVPRLLRGLDVFVLPSLAEGISNTILEAMATGLPVVATRVGGNPELVEEGVTGLLVPPADPLALAGAISVYLKHPERIAHHGRAGRERIEREFSLTDMVERYMAVYNSVLAERGFSTTRS